MPPDPSDSTAPEIDLAATEFRYRREEYIGHGGVGVVSRVHDSVLRRTLAMKVLREQYAEDRKLKERFVTEAQITAQLQHPGIVPVHDLGRLPNGEIYFTMKEVRGRTLSQAIRQAHRDGPPSPSDLRLLVDHFHRVCEAMAYAHSRGVVHRDLKPANIMLGDFGEVLVMDWGLARAVGVERPPRPGTDPTAEDTESMAGIAPGTLAYMSPEQAQGSPLALRPQSDVFALGAILFEILWGGRAYPHEDDRRLLLAVALGAVQFPEDGAPDDLADVCRRAMARDPADRPAHAGELADEVLLWLGGARRRARAAEDLDRALRTLPEAHGLRNQAVSIRARAVSGLDALPAWEPIEHKRPYWDALDRADQLEQQARQLETQAEILLHGALSHASDLELAHAALAALYRKRIELAEQARDHGTATRTLDFLRNHVLALPAGHPERAGHEAFLAGTGAVTLHTQPPGATVELHRCALRDRRLQTERVRELGTTPLVEVPLDPGSWILVIRHPDCAEVRYPVALVRQQHWRGIPPQGSETHPIQLPPADLPDDQVYVPAGWFEYGTDRPSGSLFERGRTWCDGFVIDRFPVTNAQYLDFLNDLVARGDEAAAEGHAPSFGPEQPVYGRDEDGRYVLVPDPDGDQWEPDWPVVCVHLWDAEAYAAWRAQRDGQPWRIPGELEWEKAARGVDGRLYPWGNFQDANWANIAASRPGRAMPVAVTAFPEDVSPYGVRGMGGNSDDWTRDPLQGRPPIVAGRVAIGELTPEIRDARVVRGGFWSSNPTMTRTVNRHSVRPSGRLTHLGFRLVRSWP